MSVPPLGLPVDQVKAMRAQGLDNNQIIQALQKDGYTSSQIFDALNQIEEVGPPADEFPNISQNVQDEAVVYPGARPAESSQEELIESIIDEKWNELLKDITKIVDWKNQLLERAASVFKQSRQRSQRSTICTPVPAVQMHAPQCVRNHKATAKVEHVFRSLRKRRHNGWQFCNGALQR